MKKIVLEYNLINSGLAMTYFKERLIDIWFFMFENFVNIGIFGLYMVFGLSLELFVWMVNCLFIN